MSWGYWLLVIVGGIYLTWLTDQAGAVRGLSIRLKRAEERLADAERALGYETNPLELDDDGDPIDET